MAVEVSTPEEHLGGVIGDLKQRRSVIQEIGARGETSVIQAFVPLRKMFGYATDLRSLSKGRAAFSMNFHAFDLLSAETGA